MKFVHRFLSVSAAAIALLGIVGCGEDNESAVKNDSKNVSVDKTVPSSYDGLKPKANTSNPYTGGGGYPGAAKAAPAGGAGGGGAAEKK